MKIISVDGRLKADAELRTSKNGRPYLYFELANNTYTRGAYETTWYNVASFEDSVKNRASAFKKGSYVFVSGNHEISATVKDKVYINQSIIANSVELLNGNRNGNQNADGTTTNRATTGTINVSQPDGNYSIPMPPANPQPVSAPVQEAIVPNKLTQENPSPVVDPMLSMPSADIPTSDDDLPF